MSKSIISWVKKNIITRFLAKDQCPHKERCFEVLQIYLDGEATREETERFHRQMDSCWQCYKEFELDKYLKKMVKERSHSKEVPEGLVESIHLKLDKLY